VKAKEQTRKAVLGRKSIIERGKDWTEINTGLKDQRFQEIERYSTSSQRIFHTRQIEWKKGLTRQENCLVVTSYPGNPFGGSEILVSRDTQVLSHPFDFVC
jgi:hypothetical protein